MNPYKAQWQAAVGDVKQLQHQSPKSSKLMWAIQTGDAFIAHQVHSSLPKKKSMKPIDLPYSGLAAMVAVNALGVGMILWGDPMTKTRGIALLAIPEPIVFMAGEFLA